MLLASTKVRLSLYLGGRFDGCSILQEKFHDLDPVLLAGDVKRGEPVESASVGIGLAVKQELGHPDVAAVGSHVQGRQVVDRHFIHWGLVVKQDPEEKDPFKIMFETGAVDLNCET